MDLKSDILITHEPIVKPTLQKYCKQWFGDMVKIVVDIDKEKIALGGSLHADGESLLLEKGSLQKNLWGINIYPENEPSSQIEYTALINIRPTQDNTSLYIEDKTVRNKIYKIIKKLIPIEG